MWTRIHRCSLDSCHRWTIKPFHRDPRKRWLVDVLCIDPDSDDPLKKIRVTLCPEHCKHFFHLEEEHFVQLEKIEAPIRQMQLKGSLN